MTQVRNIRHYLNEWVTHHGDADPRPMLDSYFWSYACNRKQLYDDTLFKIDAWCNQTFGDENWHRLFNKYWFTSQEEYIFFTLTWGTEQNFKTDLEEF